MLLKVKIMHGQRVLCQHVLFLIFCSTAGISGEHATLLQRLPNVVQTAWTFRQRWVDVVLMSRIHWVYFKKKVQFLMMKNSEIYG